ncbi:MAG: SPOR domain-containing protein [Chromatiales bacterium]
MDRALRQRLVGAAVLVGLAVIFVPMLLDDSAIEEPRIEATNIPPRPSEEFSSKIVPLEPVQPVSPVAPPPAATGAAPESPVQPTSPAKPLGPAAAVPKPLDESESTPSSAPAVPEDAGGENAATRVGITAWAVQLGSFASEQNAKELEQRLRKEGYTAFVEKVDGDEGQKFRVRVGPELIRAKAQETRDKLDKDLNLKGILVRYP